MPKYEVRLESLNDSQARITTLNADSEQDARRACETTENRIAEFSLLPPDKDTWENPPGQSEDDADGLVDLSRWDAHDKAWADWAAGLKYRDAVKAANNRLTALAERVEVRDGKVKRSQLKGRALARYLAHAQEQPYSIVDIREVSDAEVEAQALVRSAMALQSNPDAWEAALEQMRAQGIPMNAVTAILYGVPWQKQIDGSGPWVWSSATVQTSLHTGYTANQDVDDFFNDVSANEITGTGYTANGVTLASKTSTYDTASDQIRLDAADVSWTTSTLSATDAVVWVNTAGASSTDMLLGTVDFGATVTTTAGTFQITWDATGILVVDVT